MDKVKSWWAAHGMTKRRLIQLYAALLYNAHVKGFIEGNIYTGPVKNICVPGFNCYSCPGAIGSCPLGALQNALASSGARAPWYVLGILLLFGLTLGRIVCGWLCPLGMLQELLHKLPTPKWQKNRVTRALSWVKYAVLLVFVIALPLYFGWAEHLPVPAFCKYICPAGTAEGALPLMTNPVNGDKVPMLGALFTNKFVLLVVISVLCVFAYRAFCRFLCPLGAIYGLFAKLSVLGVKVSPKACIDCGKCVQHCKMDIRRVGDHECIQCGECIPVCPTQSISWKGGAIRLHPNEGEAPAKPAAPSKRRTVIGWLAALAVLAGVMVWVNQPAAPAEPETPVIVDDGTPVGHEVGMRAPDFTVPLYQPLSGDFTLSEHRGKVVVLNFWATWCPACVEELPHFAQLQQNYPDDVAVIAVHHSLVTEDVQAYLDRLGVTGMAFALDADGSVIAAYNGSTMLPMTVVIGRDGKIAYNSTGSVTYELLEALVQPLR